MSDLKNPMRFSIKNRSIDIKNLLRQPDFKEKHVTEIDIIPSEGNIYIYWERGDCDE